MRLAKITVPEEHGELFVDPPYAEWAALIEANRAAAAGWNFAVAGIPAVELRQTARSEVLAAAASFSARLGVEVRALGEADAPLIVTGHQPELYHPGVWAKNFLLQRFSDERAVSAFDIVVDTDGFDAVAIKAPCLEPEVRQCRQNLAVGIAGGCYVTAPPPSAETVAEFCERGGEMLATLPASEPQRHFSAFCEALGVASVEAGNLAEAMTIARRRYEAPAGTDYAELPVSWLARTRAFAAFVADVALDALRFAEAYNGALAEYRTRARVRSAAQPMPDLAVEIDGARVELPLWAIRDGARETLFAERTTDSIALTTANGDTLALLPLDPSAAIDTVAGLDALIAPKALVLTLFARLFASDLFVHGLGGARYDQVTDEICRRYFDIEAPGFTVASLTVHLPLGMPLVSDADISAAKERLNRLEHNPDQMLAEVSFADAAEREQALSLVTEKTALVRDIAQEGADKKTLGLRIREVNRTLADLVEPLRIEYETQLKILEQERDAAEIFTDRTYPFCLWDPIEIAEKVC